jgi:tripartite-type tricarboxylate transporter receptor subunit TctC
MDMRLLWISLVASCVLAAAMTRSTADDWPTRPVKIVVSVPAGGTVDVVARAVAQKLSESFGQSFYVEDRPGGNGNIGTDYVAKSAPDGYTLLMGPDMHFTISPSFEDDLPFRVKDFAPISLVADFDFVLSAHPSLPANNIADLVTLAKKQPGKINYGSYGPGSTHELVMEQLQQLRGFKLTEVPYRGSGQALPDLLSGRIQLTLLGVSPMLPYLRDGRLKALAVSASRRNAALPDVPTIAEQGFPGFEASGYVCFYAPTGTPQRVIERLQQETVRALDARDVDERLRTDGMTPVGSTSSALAERVETDTAKWAAVIGKIRARK